VLVVDDCSTDGTMARIEEAARRENRVRVVRHETNGGAGMARATVLREAKGEFVCFFDDDDESHPGRVSRQMVVLTESEARLGTKMIACYAGGTRRYDNGYEVDAPGIGTAGEPPHGAGVADYLLVNIRRPDWFYGAGVPTCALMARRETLFTVGGFDPAQRRLEDLDFAIRLALAGGHFVGTKERLYVRHMTGGRDKSPEAMLAAQLSLTEKYRGHLDQTGRYEYARRWPRLRHWHFKRRYGRFLVELVGLVIRYPSAAFHHLLRAGPARLAHERRMARGLQKP
jgi:glycosyltransferase involved in cell wall biosynthesis